MVHVVSNITNKGGSSISDFSINCGVRYTITYIIVVLLSQFMFINDRLSKIRNILINILNV